MFGLSGIIAITQFIGMIFLPESPVWLQQQGRTAEARLAIARISDGRDPEGEDDYLAGSFELNSDEEDEEQEGSTSRERREGKAKSSLPAWNAEASLPPPLPLSRTTSATSLRQYCLRHVRKYSRQIIITIFLASAQTFCGQGNILNFAPKIFADAGVAADSTLLSTLMLGAVKFISTVLVILSVDRIGRRILLLVGIAIICFSLTLLIIAFSGEGERAGLAISGTVGVVVGYSTSFGPLTWLITSELFPTEIRGRALGVQAIISGFCAYLASFTLLSGMDRYGETAPFIFYFAVSLLSLLFSIAGIPDTGHRTPCEIADDLNNMWMWRPRPSALASFNAVEEHR